MRTAAEILTGKDLFSAMDLSNLKLWDSLIEKINEAREETIKECAKRATIGWYPKMAGERPSTNGVDKESILSLIKELK